MKNTKESRPLFNAFVVVTATSRVCSRCAFRETKCKPLSCTTIIDECQTIIDECQKTLNNVKQARTSGPNAKNDL